MTAPRWQDVAASIDRAQRHLDCVPMPCVETQLAIVELQTAEQLVGDIRDAALARLAATETGAERATCSLHDQGPDGHSTFACSVCWRRTCWSRGASDDMPGACDDCWSKAHALGDPLLDTAQTSDADAADACRAVGVDPVALGERGVAFVKGMQVSDLPWTLARLHVEVDARGDFRDAETLKLTVAEARLLLAEIHALRVRVGGGG